MFRTPGNLAKVVDHRRRDERRADRGRRRGRLARGRAPAARVPVPGDRRAGGAARGDARDPPRAVGGARRLVVPRARTTRSRTRCFRPKPGSLAGRERRPAADPRRRRGLAALVPDRGPLRRRVQPVLVEPAGRGPEVRGRSTTTLRAAGRDPATLTRSAMVGMLMGRDEDEVRRRESRRCSRRSARRTAGEAWFEPRRARWIHGTPDQARASRRGVRRRPASSGSCSRTSCRATSR